MPNFLMKIDTPHHNRQIKIVQRNVRGLRKKGKWAELEAFIFLHRFDVVVLNETLYADTTKLPKLKGTK